MASASASAAAASGLRSKLKSIPLEHPFAFGVFVSTVKTSFSDLLVQTAVERREKIDWKRNAAFATFGCFYLGGVQYGLYVKAFGKLFPNAASFAAKGWKEKLKDGKGMRALFGQVFLDQCVHHPLMYFPVFYCTKEMVMHDKPDFWRVLSEYRSNMSEDLLALWKVWVPSTVVNFAFMPMWARIPWVAGTSLLWTCILSAMRGGDVSHRDDLAGGSVTGVTMRILREGLDDLFACPVDLDPNLSHVCVSAVGPDRVGWVARLAGSVADGGGNVTNSKMLRMGHDFTVLMHVAVKPERQRELIETLRNDSRLEGLEVRTSSLTRRQTGKYDRAVMGLQVHCVGEDRPGMLASIASVLSRKRLSVENISTELRTDRKTRKRDFVIDAECIAPYVMDQKQLDSMIEDLNEIKIDLDLKVLDVRVLHAERP